MQNLGHIRHLLHRAGFNAPSADVVELAAHARADVVDRLVDGPLQGLPLMDLPDIDPEAERLDDPRQQAPTPADARQLHAMEQWWMRQMVQSQGTLEEQMVLLWHDHFACSYRTVLSSTLMNQQHMLLREHALGNFGDLLRAMVRNPAMLRFLDNDKNRRGRPNENLARELMELFTLGEGNYTEEDVKEGARALTGYGIGGQDFWFDPEQHDAGVKRILGRSGRFNAEDFVEILLEQEACARFIAGKLYGHFVADTDRGVSEDGKAQIERLARLLRDYDYELAPALKMLLTSEHFYEPANVGAKIKSPLQLVVGLMRSMDLSSVQDGMVSQILAFCTRMGQRPFHPPSVAGWGTGRIWLNASTLFVRQNACVYLLTGETVEGRTWDPAQAGFDPLKLVEQTGQSPEAVVDHLLETMLAVPCPDRSREQLLAHLKRHGRDLQAQAVTEVMLLITAMPEYQLH